jgi:hypothetical protein
LTRNNINGRSTILKVNNATAITRGTFQTNAINNSVNVVGGEHEKNLFNISMIGKCNKYIEKLNSPSLARVLSRIDELNKFIDK